LTPVLTHFIEKIVEALSLILIFLPFASQVKPGRGENEDGDESKQENTLHLEFKF
jgi:hypothetical protein